MVSSSDRAGNSLKDARLIAPSSVTTSVRDRVSSLDRNDFYKVQLSARSSLNLALTRLSTNADLALLDGAGKLLQRSARRGSRNEAIQQTLEAGTYYVRVFYRGGNTRYQLATSATPTALEIPATSSNNSTSSVNNSDISTSVVTTTQPKASTFDIEFDYRFDTDGWFTPERRAVLESAAKLWKNIIQDEFEAVPVGTTLSVINPQTNAVEEFASDREINDLVIFVGAKNIDGSGKTLAEGGPSGYWTVGSSLETRFRGNNFEPWTASLSFDNLESWFFDATPDTADDIPTGQTDFLAIAVHEIGHALGIGTASAFEALVSNNTFTGSKAIARNGGNPIPLTLDGHVKDGFIASGVGTEALMDPTQIIGSRKLPTNLDIALLEDIGYSVTYIAG